MLQALHSAADFPRLSPGEVHVWCVPLSSNIGNAETLDALLSEDEREKAGWFVFERDKVRYVAARGILRRLLGGYLNIDPSEIRFSYGAFGKPELRSPSMDSAPTGHCVSHFAPGEMVTGRLAERLRFNLSHAGGWAAYAVSGDRDIGIDIEPLRHDVPWQELAPLVFSPNEQAEFAEIPPHKKATAFLRGWTRKEAYLKGRDEGLSLSLHGFDVPLGISTAPFRVKSTFASTAVSDEWWLYPIDFAEDYVATLAVEGRPVRVEVHRRCCVQFADVQDLLKTKDIPCSVDEFPVLLPQCFLRRSPLGAQVERIAWDPLSKLGAAQTHAAFM